MKTTVYLRVGDKGKDTHGSRHVVRAGTKPSQQPLETATSILPTCAFAIELDIPDKAFTSAARVVAELKVPPEKLTIAAQVAELAEED